MLTLHNVRIALGGVPIVHGVDLTVAAGEWVTVIGPNGAGKSTLLRAVGGLLPFTGTIALDGTPLPRLRRRERARLVAMVPQKPQVPPGMTVLDYVLLGRTPYISPLGSESTADVEAAQRVLARLDLLPFAERPLQTLSGGEQQRAFLARALTQEPRLLLLDEPTSALDIGHQQEVLELVDDLRRDGGLTVLATLHDLAVAGGYADRLVLLAQGRVVAAGPAAQVLTAEVFAEHYGARVRVVPGEDGPLIIPIRGRPHRAAGA